MTILKVIGWVAVAALLVLALSVIALFVGAIDWRLKPAIRRARKHIEQIVRQRCEVAKVFPLPGATKIDPKHLTFCILTETDQQRNQLRADPRLAELYRDALLRANYPATAVPFVHFWTQSQETVNRDYNGDFREAIENP